ncbi:MAG: HAD family phosphatase [Acidobacteria bacterium]|nr:MAG: HAD family phosphatase [Acidobacteriota bacterium]
MREITALFWDVGGVLLTNGWDRASRHRAAEQFHLDWEDFQDRHELVIADFETGRLTLEEYLERTIFHRPRRFTREEFTAFMWAQSQPIRETLAIVERLARSGRYLLATLNNESLELNEYRIERFGLRNLFALFFSSCFLGVRKPDRAIYQIVLRVTQRTPEECLFIDDRALNLECARQLGMRTIHYQNPQQLQRELRRHGVALELQ